MKKVLVRATKLFASKESKSISNLIENKAFLEHLDKVATILLAEVKGNKKLALSIGENLLKEQIDNQ